MPPPQLQFKKLDVPGTKPAVIPTGICLAYPTRADVPPNDLHFLARIPWDDGYLLRVPERYRAFFQFVLPYIRVRTTDVHTACSLGLLNDLLTEYGDPVNERVVAIALILHDTGWSRMSEQEIAASLGVTGLKLTGAARVPKDKHAPKGVQIARKVLHEFAFAPPLSSDEQQLILDAILYHDRADVVRNGNMPPEVQLVVDLDHIWSFTFENFWQDTVRKGVNPDVYVRNLELDLDDYFVTEAGKNKARYLLSNRQKEVASWMLHVADQGLLQNIKGEDC